MLLVRRWTGILKFTHSVSEARENETVLCKLIVNRCDPNLQCGLEVSLD